MANEADIKIGLQTVGADAAAAEMRKVPDAIEEIPKATNSANDGIDDLIKRMKESRERAEALSKDAKKTAEEGMAAAKAQMEKEQAAANSIDGEAALQNIGKLRARITLVTAALATIAAASRAAFGQMKADMEEATEAGSKWEAQNIKTAATIQILGDPVGAVKAGWKSIGDTALRVLDKIIFKGDLANMKAQEGAALTARSEKASYEKRAADHATMIQKILNAEIKLQEDRDNLERAREQRAGTTSEKSAANEVARIINKQAAENKIIIEALAEARRAQAAALVDMKNLDLGNEAKDAAREIYNDAKKQIAELSRELGFKIQSDTLAVQNAVETAQAEAKQGLEEKLKSNAKELQQTIEAIISEKGGDAQVGTQMALKAVEGLMADGKVTLDEANRLNDAAVQFYQSADSNTAALRESTRKLIEADQKAVEDYRALNEQVDSSAKTQQTAISQIQAQITQGGTNTVQGLQGLGTTIVEQGNATVATIATVQASLGQITNRLAAQQTQINQLAARIR